MSITQAVLTLELADGHIITSNERIYSLFKNAIKYAHLLYNSQLNVHPRQGNDFFYEVYPSGQSAMRKSFSSIIQNKLIPITELLEDMETVIKDEVERCRGL